MENNFLLYKDSLSLKKLGYNKPCFGYYCNDLNILYSHLYCGNVIADFNIPPDPKNLGVYAPLYQQAFEFFRENYQLFSSIERLTSKDDLCNYSIKRHDGIKNIEHCGKGYDTEKNAEIACLKELIRIVTQLD